MGSDIGRDSKALRCKAHGEVRKGIQRARQEAYNHRNPMHTNDHVSKALRRQPSDRERLRPPSQHAPVSQQPAPSTPEALHATTYAGVLTNRRRATIYAERAHILSPESSVTSDHTSGLHACLNATLEGLMRALRRPMLVARAVARVKAPFSQPPAFLKVLARL